MTTVLTQTSANPSSVHADQQQVLGILNRLVHLNKESERGFETAAEHVKNRGLKILLKTFAKQRSCFATDLSDAATKIRPDWNNQNGGHGPSQRILASIHRGWIDIKAAMTIGRESTERVVLVEGQRAEGGIAVREYQKALRMKLPKPLHAKIQSQLREIEAVHRRLSLLAGQNGRRQIIQLFDTVHDAEESASHLMDGIAEANDLSVTPVEKVMEFYECNCQSSRIWDGISAGGVIGVFVGLAIGLFIGLITYAGSESAMLSTIWLPTFLGILIGAMGGALFGALIGQATVEDDQYDYHESVRQGSTLLVVEVAESRAAEIQQRLRSHRLQPESLNMVLG